MSAIGSISNVTRATMVAPIAPPKAPAKQAVSMDSDGDFDGSRAGEVEAGKGGSIDVRA